MSNALVKEFQAQLTIAMDSVLEKALFEITRLFENSLHGHQMELDQRGEEIAQLKIKLQTAEVKLSERESGVDRGDVVNETQMNESPKECEDAVGGETSDVPETDFVVPDDWCAPLSCETPTKQDASVCHNVKLRSLYIPLWQIPIFKQEGVNHDIKSQQETQKITRSGRNFSSEGRHQHAQDNSSAVSSSSMNTVVHEIKGEYTEVTDTPADLRREGRNSTGKEQKNPLKSKTEERQIPAAESQSTEQATVEGGDEESYPCNFCDKVLDTSFGQSVHSRSHMRCKGCKKVTCNKGSCVKLKRWLVRKAKSTARKKGSTKNLSCTFCEKKFQLRCRLREHVRTHTGEKPFECSVCSKKFHIKRFLQLHMLKVHQDQAGSKMNGNLAWTQPLEETEDNRDTGQSASNIDRVPGSRLETSRQCSKGFSCSLCQKHIKHKYLLLEHFLSHTADDLFKCEICFAKFTSRSQLYMHKRKSHKPIIQCQKCDKKFLSQALCDKHVSRHHKNWNYICNLCGKGFFTKGPFQNHVNYHR